MAALKVKELVERLQKFDPELPVWVSDGYAYNFYMLTEEATVEVFTDVDGTRSVDIGVGGMKK